MYDLAHVNEVPGTCGKCYGSGVYQWGASVNGRMTGSGPCHSCGGKGKQTAGDIRRNEAYNRHKLASIFAADMAAARRTDAELEREDAAAYATEDAADDGRPGTAAAPQGTEPPAARAEYKGRTYLLRWTGRTKYGHRCKLAFLDGSKEFWADSGLVRILETA